ncbi:MAG TPA: hypothetical protein VFN94_06655 [Nitrospiria bacterium]|nr:hypothetical protein [Nitrospiria bacterium]
MRWTVAVLAGCAWLVGQEAVNARASDSVTERLDRIESRLDQLGGGGDESHGGTGRLSWHGYGELHFNSPEGSGVPDDADPAIMDLHRMVWGLSYQFNDRISLHTEVDFEHAAQEMELEFAYVDFAITPAFNVRAGSMLMPVGPLNEFHEPTLFYSVERPYVQRTIIPTSWQEGGAGVFGAVNGLKYRVYLVSGLNAEGFTASDGIRGGRGGVAEQPSEDLAVVGRLEYVGLPGVELGLSAYQGGANTTKNPALSDAGVGIWEADARLRMAGLDLRGVLASVTVDGADQITAFTIADPTVDDQLVGEEMMGWYLEAAYDVLKLVNPEGDQALQVFVRYEDFNTQKSVPTGFTAVPANDRQVMTAGLAYFPIPDVAVKADLESWEDGSDNDGSRFNVGVAYQF